MFYSFYQKVGGTWMANHRFPLTQAISSAKFVRDHFNERVAIVPDNADPAPYLSLVDGLA